MQDAKQKCVEAIWMIRMSRTMISQILMKI